MILAGVFALASAAPLAAQAPVATVSIDAGTVEAEISPLLYGQFLEFMFEGVKEGITAELLRDRGFEGTPNAIGLPRYWERYPDDRNDDYGLAFRWDDSVAFPVEHPRFEDAPEQHALRADVGGGVVERHGLFQSRIPVRADVAYHGYLWLKTDGYDGSVRVALEEDIAGGAILAEAEIPSVASGDWRRYAFTLEPRRNDRLARFAILLPGRGTVWLDQVSLVPGDAVDGVRADVLERIRALEPAFLRWPGGNVAQDYHWEWGIGPRDRRPTWVNLSWRNEPEPGDFGTVEYAALSRRVGAEPTLPRPRRAPRCPDLGAGQRDLGGLGPGSLGRRHLRPELRPLPRRHAGGRPRSPVHRRGRQRHGVEPDGDPGGGGSHRLPGDPPLLRPPGDGGRPPQPDGSPAALRGLLR